MFPDQSVAFLGTIVVVVVVSFSSKTAVYLSGPPYRLSQFEWFRWGNWWTDFIPFKTITKKPWPYAWSRSNLVCIKWVVSIDSRFTFCTNRSTHLIQSESWRMTKTINDIKDRNETVCRVRYTCELFHSSFNVIGHLPESVNVIMIPVCVFIRVNMSC